MRVHHRPPPPRTLAAAPTPLRDVLRGAFSLPPAFAAGFVPSAFAAGFVPSAFAAGIADAPAARSSGAEGDGRAVLRSAQRLQTDADESRHLRIDRRSGARPHLSPVPT